MIKYYFGPITSPKTGRSRLIVVNCLSKDNVKSMLVGAGIVMIGIAYMGKSCFKNGAKAFEMAELKAYEALDLIKQ